MINENHQAEVSVQDGKKNEKEGLSAYSYKLIFDTRELIASLFPDEKNIDNQVTLDVISMNKQLIRTCIVSLLKDMNPEDASKFKENPGDLRSVLLLSVEKTDLLEDEKKSIREKIKSITLEDIISQVSIADKLDLYNLDADIRKMTKALYVSIKENNEAVQAHAYMNLTER